MTDGISMPSGMGGLMRYDAEYSSRFMIAPSTAIGFVIGVLALAFALRVLFPV